MYLHKFLEFSTSLHKMKSLKFDKQNIIFADKQCLLFMLKFRLFYWWHQYKFAKTKLKKKQKKNLKLTEKALICLVNRAFNCDLSI